MHTGAEREAPPESPCVKICVVGADGYCQGCLRTLGEIAAWSEMSAAQQWALLAKLAQRRQRLT
jgi:uncharacterized protein